MGAGKVFVVRHETKGSPQFQPLSSFFVGLGFALQAIMKGELFLSSFGVEPRRDLAFHRSREVRGQPHSLQANVGEEEEGTSSHERKEISTEGFLLEPPEASPASVLRPI